MIFGGGLAFTKVIAFIPGITSIHTDNLLEALGNISIALPVYAFMPYAWKSSTQFTSFFEKLGGDRLPTKRIRMIFFLTFYPYFIAGCCNFVIIYGASMHILGY